MFVRRDFFPLFDGHLSGEHGTYRSKKQNIANVKNDSEAINNYLFRDLDPKTRTSYAEKIRKLRLWALLYLDKPISSLSTDDALAFAEFLQNLPEDWVCPNCTPMFSEAWRPFSKPVLSQEHIRKMLSICSQFYTHFVQIGYMDGNPFSSYRLRRVDPTGKSREDLLENPKIFSGKNWQILVDYLHSSDSLNFRRKRLMFGALYFCSLRVNELATAVMGDFYEESGQWYFFVRNGKFRKVRSVGVPRELMKLLSDYRTASGLQPLPEQNENLPVIMQIKHKKTSRERLICSSMRSEIKRSVEGAAMGFCKTQAERDELKKGSAHYLRRQMLTDQEFYNISIEHSRDNAGHVDLSTTQRYRKTNAAERCREVQDIGWVKKQSHFGV